MEGSNASGPEDHRSSAKAAEPSRLAAGLECRIGRARLAVPVEFISRIIEYKVVSLPLARPWMAGIAIHEGVPIISVALVAIEDNQPHQALSKGILLNVPASPIGWALEVNETFSFVRATVRPRRKEAGNQVPRWITGAHTDDGRSIGWIHVSAMLADLAQLAEQIP